MSFNAEAGKIYYIRETIMEITTHQNSPGMKLELIDSAEGQLLISASAPKQRPSQEVTTSLLSGFGDRNN